MRISRSAFLFHFESSAEPFELLCEPGFTSDLHRHTRLLFTLIYLIYTDKSTLMHLHLRSGVNTHSRCDVQVCGSLILICIISKHLETVFINDLMYLLVYL